MNLPPARPLCGATKLGRRFLTALIAATLMLGAQTIFAGSATWDPNPTSDWNTAANWTPNTVPNAPADIATFGSSNTTAVSLSAITEVNGIVFSPAAPPFYTITVSPPLTLTISGAGITNNSNFNPTLVTTNDTAVIQFLNSATAGVVAFTNNGGGAGNAPGGRTEFFDTSTAGGSVFSNSAGAVSNADGGRTEFFDTSTADTAFFFNSGSAIGASGSAGGGVTQFNDNSTAGQGIFTTNGGSVSGARGGFTDFLGTSTAGNGSFTTNGAVVSGAFGGNMRFLDSSTAGNGTFTVNAGAVSSAFGGFTAFLNTSSAGNGTFTNNGGAVGGASGGSIQFRDTSTAGNGAFNNISGAASTATGGHTHFFGTSTAGTASFFNSGSVVSGTIPVGQTNFSGAATAGNGTFTNNGGAVNSASGGRTGFDNTSTAGNGAFTNNGGEVSGAFGGSTLFFQTSTAGNGAFTTNGGAVSGALGGLTEFFNTSTAGNGIFINGGAVSGAFGGRTLFEDTSTAANSTLIAHGGAGGGGLILFEEDSTGGTARVEVFGNGNLDISPHFAPGVTVGSIQGDGDLFLGANNLTVGSNNLSTTFSGFIQEGGLNGGTGGSLSKIGTSTLRLSGANTYTGGTVVEAGRVLANNSSGSGTGIADVKVLSGGVIGGTGTITGEVGIVSGGAVLGGNAIAASGSLKIASNLGLSADAVIQLVLGPSGTHSTLTRTGGTWTFAPNQKFNFLDLGAQPGVYDNIITGLAADPGGVASWTIINAGFTGTFSYDGAGNIDLNLTAAAGPALQLTSAASRKTHGGAGNFDINLPLSGAPGVECRSSGGNHTLRFTFTNKVVSGNASVTTGGGVAGSQTFSSNVMIVSLTGVVDVQKITVTLSNVTDNLAQVLPDKEVSVNMLRGDTTGNKSVNSSDIGQTKSRSGQAATASNFRSDVTVNGSINASDIGLVKSRSGAAVP